MQTLIPRSRAGGHALGVVEACQACYRPVRRAHVVTAVTVMLDAAPRTKGTYYFDGPDGLIIEDRDGIVRDPKFLRHRCDGKHQCSSECTMQ